MDAITSAVPDTAGAPDATPDEVLDELRPLGEELKAWRHIRTPDGNPRRAEIRARIRPVLDRGITAGLTRYEMAGALGVVVQTVDNIRNDTPTGRWANSGDGASLTPELRKQVYALGCRLAEWRNVKGEDAKMVRAGLRADVRKIVKDAPEATMMDIAGALDITPQQLFNIMREDTTGRNR